MIEGLGGWVAFPDVEGDVVETFAAGIVPDILEKSFSYVLSAGRFIDAYIVHIECPDGHQATAFLTLMGAEGISKYLPLIFEHKYGRTWIGKDLQQFVVSVLFAFGFEKVRTALVMNGKNLLQKTVHGLDVTRYCLTYQTHRPLTI